MLPAPCGAAGRRRQTLTSWARPRPLRSSTHAQGTMFVRGTSMVAAMFMRATGKGSVPVRHVLGVAPERVPPLTSAMFERGTQPFSPQLCHVCEGQRSAHALVPPCLPLQAGATFPSAVGRPWSPGRAGVSGEGSGEHHHCPM